MKVISLFNRKGGVGKTTASVNIGAVLSSKGKKVLLIDTDSQCNLTTTILKEELTQDTICEVLRDPEYDIKNAIRETEYENLFAIASSDDLKNVPVEIASVFSISPNHRLFKQLKKVEDDFDYCIIDCAPSESVITGNVLLASDEVLIPIAIQGYSVDGINKLLSTVVHYKTEFFKDIKIKGILDTKFDKRFDDHKKTRKELIKEIGDLYMPVDIRTDETVNKAVKANMPVVFYDPKSKAARDYVELVEKAIL